MRRRVLVIGAGQFGSCLAEDLAGRDVDVSVMDPREDRVAELRGSVDQAVIGSGADDRVLESLDIPSFNLVVNAIGEEALEASILCSALLVERGAQRVLARVVSPLHERIVRSLGVDETVHPESDTADLLAKRIAAPGLRSHFDLEEGIRLMEVEVPETWIGRNLKDLALRSRYAVNVVALRRPGTGGRLEIIPTPSPDDPLQRGEIVILLGSSDRAEAFLKEMQ